MPKERAAGKWTVQKITDLLFFVELLDSCLCLLEKGFKNRELATVNVLPFLLSGDIPLL